MTLNRYHHHHHLILTHDNTCKKTAVREHNITQCVNGLEGHVIVFRTNSSVPIGEARAPQPKGREKYFGA